MPYYEIITNPGNFSVNRPENLINENLLYIKQGFNQKSEVFSTANTGTTILGRQMIAGWVVRSPTGAAVTDSSDTAQNIYNAISNTLNSNSNGDFGILNGFYFDYGIYNEGTANITYQSGDANVSFGAGGPTTYSINTGAVGWFRATVTSNTGPVEVYINKLSN
jgi:hypothetical protein